MVRKLVNLGCLGLLVACGAAQAQPRITSLGQPVTAVGVSNGGGRVLASTNCGPMTFDLGAGVTLTSVSNPASTSLGSNCLSSDGQKAWGAVAYPGGISWILTTGNTVAGAWSQATNSWTPMPGLPADPATNLRGSGTSGNNTSLTQARGASRDGRYIVGQGYAYPNTATTGWAASGSVFVYRPFIWDTQTNTVTTLPTPPQVNGSGVVIANRYKDGRAICVSNDGSVIMGGYNANSAGGATGGSMAVWYRQGDGTYLAEAAGQLPVGTDDGSRTVDSFVMSSDGLIIVGTSFDTTDVNGNPIPGTYPANLHSFIAKWTRPDAASRTWTRTKLYDMSTSQTSATPGSISSWWQAYNCSFDVTPAYPDPRFGTIVGMSDDGNTIIGRLEYSTCGSFVDGGWIWKAGTGPGTGMMDLYDYLVAQNTIDINNPYYAMYGTLANHAGCGLGYPTGISADGNTIIGYGGPFTPLGPAWVVDMTGASSAKAPFAVCSPSNITGYTHCSSPIVQFGFAAGGSGTLTYTWNKGTPGSGTALSNGDQASPVGAGVGANITGADTFLVRINYPNLADAGSYYCTVASSLGGSVDSAPATATAATITAVTNDLCANAQDIFLGANAADASQEKTYDACAAFIDEFRTGTSCYANNSVSDVWFKYTPTASGDIRIENCASTYFSSVITVYDACGGNELACSSATNSSSSASTLPSCSKVRLNRVTVTQNQPVYIRVANQGSASATSNIGKVRIYPSPAVPTNDGCASPATAVLGANAFDTSEASYDANALIGGVVTCSTALSRDVWFVYTPAVKGNYVASTCYNAADVNTPLTTPNTVLTAFEAQCGGTEIICNDNSTRGTCGATTGTLTTAVNTSQIAVGLRQPGQSFWVRVGGNSATSTSAIGPGTLTIRFTAVKCNAADVAQLGGTGGFDGQNTVDDLVYFLAQFFANNLAVADITNLGGGGGPDGQVTVDDLTYFLAQFFAPCN